FDEIALSRSGNIDIILDKNERRLEIEGNVGFDLGNLVFDLKSASMYGGIIGSLAMDADGYIQLSRNCIKTRLAGTLDLGSYCEFQFNDRSIKIGGVFTIPEKTGLLEFSWDDQQINVALSDDLSASVQDLYFEVWEFTFTADLLEASVNGQFTIDWNTANKDIIISSGSGSELNRENVSILLGTAINLSVIGSLEVNADGYIHLAPGMLEIGGSEELDLGCTIIMNNVEVTVGGEFTLAGSDGVIRFAWDEDHFSIEADHGPSLNISNLQFIIGDLTVDADLIEIGAYGEFDIILDKVNSDILITSGPGAYLNISNVNITYDSILDISIFGSFNIQANGFLHLAPGLIETGFSGTLELGAGCKVQINGEKVTIGGTFELSGSNGEIGFTWTEEQFAVILSSAPEVSISELYFEFGNVTITCDAVELGANGEFTVEWDKV
ncbi:hypothetical protein KA005_72380, partial [bacterium]|nr:hypothetical protein [bacterium]